MFNSIGNASSGIGSPILANQIGGENLIRHIGNDKLIFDFHEGSGTTVHDKSHCGNDGTLGAGATAPTWRLNSLYFDGGDHIDLIGIIHGISTGGFTIRFFISNLIENKILFDQETARLLVQMSSDKINIYDGAGVTYITDTGMASIYPIDFTITRDADTNLECYVNGKSSNKAQSKDANFTYDGSSNIKIGSNYGAITKWITGTMYFFRILNKCLSGIEVQQEYLVNKFSNN